VRSGLALVLLSGVGVAQAATLEEGLALKKQQRLPEAEAALAQVVAEHPDDPAALSEWATVLGWLGRHDDAVAAWDRVLALKPGDPDATVAQARVLYWKGDRPAAKSRLGTVLAARPDDVDALTLRGDVLLADRDLPGARADYQRAQALAPSPDLEVKLARTDEPRRARVDAGGQLDRYDTSRGTEGSFFVQGSDQVADALVISGGYEQLHQFGQTDHRLNLGAYLHPIDRLLLNARFAWSPSANTVATWEASGGVELLVAGPVTALVNTRHLDFPNQGVTLVGGGARVDVAPVSVTVQAGVTASTVNDLTAYVSARVEVALAEAWRAYAGFARGDQAQLLLPTATATDWVAGVLWQASPTVGLRLDYTHETFGAFYARDSLGSAVTVKF
jgi:YaiO family outer membrane protein